jgi:polyhydroxyalkanoate synthase
MSTASREESGGELAAPLDLLLTAAATGPLRRFMPNSAWARLAGRLAAHPGTVARRTSSLAGQLGHIAIGNSDRAPSKRDRRFADPAWTQNPLLRRAVQAYLAAGETAETLLADANLAWRDDERMRFVIDNLVQALAPSNNPVISPVAWKALIDTGGLSSIAGLTNLVKDLATPPRVPSLIEPDAFTLGKTVAATPGVVVLRTPVFELVQYAPQTPKVHSVPLLIVPPVINKFYVVDMSPGRSMVDYFVKHEQQVFVISWRNPDARHRAWNVDTYGQAIIEAMGALQRICGAEQSQLMATCSGGTLAAMALAHLADTGQLDRVAGLTLGVTVLDNARAGFASAMADERTAAAALAASGRKGYLDGRSLAEVFAWLRPTDLIWNYWINNYLQGRKPAPFDVLFWNADTTRMAAALHRDLVNLGLSNALTEPGGVQMLGTDVDLGQVNVDSYVIAGIADHICPWQACYRSTQLLGGDTKFVLSTSGHIASLVNPPGNPKATFQVNDENPPDPAEWLKTATTMPDSWWPHYVSWLGKRSGPKKKAPSELGGAGMQPMEPAPGTYVFDK